MGNLYDTFMGSDGEKLSSVKAIHSYSAREEGDLEFKKGDILEVIHSNGDWWSAKFPSSEKVGYIPSNFVKVLEKGLQSKPWFYGNMSRYEAQRTLLLPKIKDGTFLVRESESNGKAYVLVVRQGNAVKQIKIHREALGFSIQKKHFTTISALIKHYLKQKEGRKITLKEPLEWDEDPETRGLSAKRNEEWDIPSQELEFGDTIGSGAFGTVYKGKWKGKTNVAIKCFVEDTTDEDFRKEVTILKQFLHPKLLQLYGVSTTKKNEVCLVTELMVHGSLLDYLKSDEIPRNQLHPIVLMDVAIQIADGMSYLENRNYIHRDLAARNILVGQNVNIKIADFGLARILKDEIYEAKEGTKLPVKWTSPEGYMENRFSPKSDVWSFGILLTELVTYGGMPYPGKNNHYVLNEVFKGARMEKPENCPDGLYQIMLSCWKTQEQERPGFLELERQLRQLTFKM